MENICVWFCLLYVCTVYTPYLHTHRRCLRHVINLSYLFLFFSSQSPQHQTVLSIPAGTSFVNKSIRTTMIETVQKVYFGDEKWTCFRRSVHLVRHHSQQLSKAAAIHAVFDHPYHHISLMHEVFFLNKIIVVEPPLSPGPSWNLLTEWNSSVMATFYDI